MKRIPVLVLIVSLFAALAACHERPKIERPSAATPIAVGSGIARSLGLQRIASDIDPETQVGTWCPNMCVAYGPLRFNSARHALSIPDMAASFAAEAQRAGYPVVGDANTLLDRTTPDLLLAAVITDMKAHYQDGLPGSVPAAKAEFELQLKWVLFDTATRRVVGELRSKGSGSTPRIVDHGHRIAATAAFSDATRGLLANPEFVALAAPSAGR